jgi:hypothetical protein
MDPLSDVLSMLTVSSTLSSRFEARGRWAFRYPQYASHIKLGCVFAGRLRMQIDGAAESVLLETGDFYLLTNGQPFMAASDPPGPLQDGLQATRDHRGADGVMRYEGQGAEERRKQGRRRPSSWPPAASRSTARRANCCCATCRR